MTFVASARMYTVTPEVEAAWRTLLERVFESAELSFDYISYPAPLPLEKLWERRDLGCVFMCGYPIAMQLSEVVPIAAPIPATAWAGGRSLYRTDLVVREDSPYETLADTFGGHLGWTVEHSHSGFNALRHHLLGYRTPERPTLYGKVTGHLTGARGIVDEVKSGEIDVGPLDAYWHLLLRRHFPEAAKGLRVIETTALAPMPSFVAAPALPAENLARLKQAFAAAASAAWFPPLGEMLGLDGFAPVDLAYFAPTLAWEAEAKAAGYPLPV